MTFFRLTTIVCAFVLVGANAFCAASEFLNDGDRDFVRQRLAVVKEEMEMTRQGFVHCCEEFRQTNAKVDSDLLEAMLEDTLTFTADKMSSSVACIEGLMTQELQEQKVRKRHLQKRVLSVKSTFRGLFEQKESGVSKRQLAVTGEECGFESGSLLSFYRTLSTYKTDSLDLYTQALDEIFQSLSPGAASLRAAPPPVEPVLEEKAKKKKHKKKKKKAGKKVSDASKEEDHSADEGESDAEEGAGAGVTETIGVDVPSGGAAAAADDLGARVEKMMSTVPEGVADGQEEREEGPVSVVLGKKKTSLVSAQQLAEEKQALELRSKKTQLLEETFAAIWGTDCEIDAKAFVKFWEHFGFMNTQRAALGNGFFILQHPNGYKLKTSHAPHSKEEKVFKMALSFAKSLLGSAGITGVRDAAWQVKLEKFLCHACEGMGR